MKAAQDVIPWKVTDISIRPYDGYWSFNPSIHFDGETWRCVLRCCDYAMPDGVTIRSKSARMAGQQTKNAMVIFDPKSWTAVQVFKMHENDNLPREACPHVGFEDMRLFRTDKGGLQGIAAALHLKRNREPRSAASDALPQHQPPEQVLLSFDKDYDIVDAHPIRGDGWSGTPQKNWVPFDHCAEPRFLYSIDKGTMFGDRGTLRADEARVSPSIRGFGVPTTTIAAQVAPPLKPTPQDHAARELRREDKAQQAKRPDRKTRIRGGDVRIVRGGRIKLDTMTSRPSSRPSSRSSRTVPMRSTDDSTRVMGSGRMLLPTYSGLRGGTQLVRVADDAWLGVGHEMKFVSGKKYYWHVFYLVDARGKMTATSDSMKFAPSGIEFAAGIAIDGDRVVVSFGVDDMDCRLGETNLSAVMEILRPIER
jgi:hypothetical protein